MSTYWSLFQVMELEESNLPLIVERCAYVYQAPDDRCGDHPQAWWPSPGLVTIPRLIICGASPSSSPLYCGDCSDVISPGIYWRGWGSGPCCHCCIIHHQPCSPSHFSSLSPHRHHCLTVTTVTTLSPHCQKCLSPPCVTEVSEEMCLSGCRVWHRHYTGKSVWRPASRNYKLRVSCSLGDTDTVHIHQTFTHIVVSFFFWEIIHI